MSNLIDNDDQHKNSKNQPTNQEIKNTNSQQFLSSIVNLLFQKFVFDQNSSFVVHHIQLIEKPINAFHYSAVVNFQGNGFQMKMISYQVVMNVWSKQSNLKYHILMDFGLQYYFMKNEQFFIMGNRNSSIYDYLIMTNNIKINPYFTQTLCSTTWSDREATQLYSIIKNFNNLCSLNTKNCKLYLSNMNQICLYYSVMVLFNQSHNNIQIKKQHVLKNLKQELKYYLEILVKIFQMNSGKQKEELRNQQNQEYMQKQKDINSSPKTHRQLKKSTQIQSQLLTLRNSFLKSHQLKHQLQKCTNSLQFFNKSIKLLVPSFNGFENKIKFNLPKDLANNQQKQKIQEQSQQFYQQMLYNYKKSMDQNEQNIKISIKNKMVHGMILINEEQIGKNSDLLEIYSQESSQSSQNRIRKKFGSLNLNKSPKNVEQKKSVNSSKSQINWIEENQEDQGEYSSSYSQKSIPGCGQSAIRRIKQHAYIVNTIFQLRKPCQKIVKKGSNEDYGKNVSNSTFNTNQMQKIQICQFFAQKSAIPSSNSSIQSFCTEYSFLLDHPDHYCKFISNYYLDVEVQQSKKPFQQRKIYSKWQKGDVYEMVYKKVLQGNKHSISPSILLNIGKQMAQALCFMNKIKIIHRDIKLTNFLLTKSMVIKLTDFGSCHPEYYSSMSQKHTTMQQYPQNPNLIPYHKKVYSKKMRTSYGLTFNSPQVTQPIRNKYLKDEYNSHINFDMYCFGLIVNELIYKNWIEKEKEKSEILSNIEFVYKNCMHEDPSFRLMAYESFILMMKMIELDLAYGEEMDRKVKKAIGKRKNSVVI